MAANQNEQKNQFMIQLEKIERIIIMIVNRNIVDFYVIDFSIDLQQFLNRKMGIFQKISSFIKFNDIFYSSQMLRYEKQNQFQTLTGGLLSIGIWITIIVSFASMIMQTFDRSNISSQRTIIKQNNPPKMQIKMEKGNNFMFGIKMIDATNQIFDLNAQKRYFDVHLSNLYMQGGVGMRFRNITLQRCTRDHWVDFPNIAEKFDIMMMDYWLCPPKDQVFDLEGSYASQFSSSVLLEVVNCNNNTKVDSVCASQQQTDDLLTNRTNLSFIVLFTNPVINPNEKNYIDYYLQQQGIFIFSKQIGCQSMIYLSDYTINSDNSFWPFTSEQTRYGSILDGSVINRALTIGSQALYVNMLIFKSSASLVIKREVQKISSVFSYIGGFFGAITAALFIMKAYTQSAFQYSLAGNLFLSDEKDDDSKQEKPSSFHLFKFLWLKLYQILQNFGFRYKWHKLNKIIQGQQEIKNHLNIVCLLRRIIAMEDYFTFLFQDYQIQGIKMQRNKTLNYIRGLRQKFSQYPDEIQQEIPIDDMRVTDLNYAKQPTNSKQGGSIIFNQSNTAKPIIFCQKAKNGQINLNYAMRSEKDDVESIDVLRLENNIPVSFDCQVIRNSEPQVLDKNSQILCKLKQSMASSIVSQRIWSRIPQKYKKQA